MLVTNILLLLIHCYNSVTIVICLFNNVRDCDVNLCLSVIIVLIRTIHKKYASHWKVNQFCYNMWTRYIATFVLYFTTFALSSLKTKELKKLFNIILTYNYKTWTSYIKWTIKNMKLVYFNLFQIITHFSITKMLHNHNCVFA